MKSTHRNKRRPVMIRTPYPTAAEVARDLGLTAAEKRAVDVFIRELMREHFGPLRKKVAR